MSKNKNMPAVISADENEALYLAGRTERINELFIAVMEREYGI